MKPLFLFHLHERYFSICPKGLKQSISAALQQEKKIFHNIYHPDDIFSISKHLHKTGLQIGHKILKSEKIKISLPIQKVFRILKKTHLLTKAYKPFLRCLEKWNLFPKILNSNSVWKITKILPNECLHLRYNNPSSPISIELHFRLQKEGPSTILSQTAILDPIGLKGILCWYFSYHAHNDCFQKLLTGKSSFFVM